jgi:hypothetical protein
VFEAAAALAFNFLAAPVVEEEDDFLSCVTVFDEETF